MYKSEESDPSKSKPSISKLKLGLPNNSSFGSPVQEPSTNSINSSNVLESEKPKVSIPKLKLGLPGSTSLGAPKQEVTTELKLNFANVSSFKSKQQDLDQEELISLQGVPHIVHFVWVGGSLPEDKFNSVLGWQFENKDQDFTYYIWADAATWHGYDKASKEVSPYIDKGIGYNVLDYSLLLDELPGNLRESFSEILKSEVYLEAGNYAAVSDIVRLLAIYKHGGFYFDFDETPRNLLHQIADKKNKLGFLCGGQNAMANNILVAMPQSAFILAYLEAIVAKYSNNPKQKIITRFNFHPLSTAEKIARQGGPERGSKGFSEWEKQYIHQEQSKEGFGSYAIFYEDVMYTTGPSVLQELAKGYNVGRRDIKLYSLNEDMGTAMGAEHGWFKLPPLSRDAWLQRCGEI